MINQQAKFMTYGWLILAIISLLILVAPFLVSSQTILSAAQWLQSPHQDGQDCSLCGMTRAFLAISRGDLHQAMHFNRGSLPLFGIMVVVVISAYLMIIHQIGFIRWLSRRIHR